MMPRLKLQVSGRPASSADNHVAGELQALARAVGQLGARLDRLAATLAEERSPRRIDLGACLVLAQDAVDLAELTGGRAESALAESLWRLLDERGLTDE